MFNIKKQYHNLKRAKEILAVFAKFGLAYFFDLPAVEKYLQIGRKYLNREQAQEIEKLSLPQKTRRAFEELGPTFIKFGQILSTRPDLIPPDFLTELSLLQDEVPSFAFADVEKTIINELGKSIEELFTEFEEKPVAAASLSQVHKARLLSGESVAVKIQRPNIRQTIETDLTILYDLAKFTEGRFSKSRVYQPADVINEFSKNIRTELDFMVEAGNLDRFAKNFQASETIVFPKVFWDYTCSKVLTMEFIDGVKISKADSSEEKYDKKIIAARAADAILKQTFEDGFFHADPHPGNIFILPENKLAFLDCGLVGKLDAETKSIMADLLIGLLSNDPGRVMSAFDDLKIIGPETDRTGLKSRLGDFLDKYNNRPLKNVSIGETFEELLGIMSDYLIKAPIDLTLLTKAIVTIEGVGRSLDSDFDMIRHARPFAQKLVAQKFEIRSIFKQSAKIAGGLVKLAEVFPEDMVWLFKSLRRGELSVGFEHKNLEKLTTVIDHASNRLSFSLVIAALIVGSSFIMSINRGPFILGFPALGIVGYLIAAVLGLSLVISIIRRGKF